MNRRGFLFGAASLVGSAGTGLCLRTSSANSASVVDEMLNETHLRNIDKLQKLVYLAYAFANIRISYNAPFGYENQITFEQHVFPWLQQSFYGDQQNISEQSEFVINILGSGVRDVLVRDVLRAEMEERLQRNVEAFNSFLWSIGVDITQDDQRTSELAYDFLRAQALFAVFAGTRLYDDMSESERVEVLEQQRGFFDFFDDFTGVWPFCDDD